MKQLIIFPRGALTPADKKTLSREGYCAIEADDPSKVVLPLPSGVVTGDMLSMAAMDAMAGHLRSDVRADFATNLHKALKARPAPLG